MAIYRIRRGYTASGTMNTYMDYAYEKNGRTYRVFKTQAKLSKNNVDFVQDGRTPLNMVLPSNHESSVNTNYAYFSSFMRILMMLVFLLAYSKVVFGGVDRSPFDTGLDIAEQISSFGSSAKTDFLSSLKDLKDDFADINQLSIANWGTIDSFGQFLGCIGSMFSAPWNLIKFVFSLIVSIVKLLISLSNFVLGV